MPKIKKLLKQPPKLFNPIWTGLGAQNAPPNLAISTQMTMKLGKDILWVEIFTN